MFHLREIFLTKIRNFLEGENFEIKKSQLKNSQLTFFCYKFTGKNLHNIMLSVGPEYTRAVNRNRANLWKVSAQYGTPLSKYHTLGTILPQSKNNHFFRPFFTLF
jgi:hypothetical protein